MTKAQLYSKRIEIILPRAEIQAIGFGFDGTWGSAPHKPTDESTNIRKLAIRARVLPNVHAEYIEGPGARFGLLGRVLGGIFGFGMKIRVARARRELKATIREAGKPIPVVAFGFSRGAIAALDFVWEVAYRMPTVKVGALILLDAVESDIWLHGWKHRKCRIPSNVQFCGHFRAYDENRLFFQSKDNLGANFKGKYEEKIATKGDHSYAGRSAESMKQMQEWLKMAGFPLEEETENE